MPLPLDTNATPRIAIIGGGITGLAAAHRITELLPNAELALFEASSRLGGVLDTIFIDGFLIERSADSFLTKMPQVVELCRRLGLAEELIQTDETRRRAFVVRAGRLLPIPDGFFLMSPRKLRPILTSPVLSLTAKLRLLAEPFIPCLKSSPSGSGQGEGDESVASFARRRLGRQTFERLVQPLIAGIYTADPEKLSMAATMPEFLALERTHGLLRAPDSPPRPGEGLGEGRVSDQSTNTDSGARYSLFAAPKHGIATLINELANRVPASSIHLNTCLIDLSTTPQGLWKLNLQSSDLQSSISPPPSAFDALILAVPAHAAAKLLDAHAPELAAELASIDYAGCAVVSLGFNRRQIDHLLEGFGFVVPQSENRRLIAASFASQKFPGRAPENAVLIRSFIGGALQPELLHLTDAELRQIAIDELRELLGITGQPIVTDVARWPRSMPQYHVGHLERIARIEQLAARHPTLALAGNAYHGVGIPQCIATAEAAAERVAARFS